jgi:hypothetical protein
MVVIRHTISWTLLIPIIIFGERQVQHPYMETGSTVLRSKTVKEKIITPWELRPD